MPGLLAGAFGLSTTVLAGGALTFASGLLAARRISGTGRSQAATPAGRRDDSPGNEGDTS
jgi:hypothetical protein